MQTILFIIATYKLSLHCCETFRKSSLTFVSIFRISNAWLDFLHKFYKHMIIERENLRFLSIEILIS